MVANQQKNESKEKDAEMTEMKELVDNVLQYLIYMSQILRI